MNRLFTPYSFPIWILIFIAAASWQPQWFSEQKNSIHPLLMAIMFAMGLSLSRQDFYQVWLKRRLIALGVGAQFLIMPLAALGLAWALQLSPEWTLGLMLVGTTAGGTASNVMTYLAKGDVALSVSMTLVSTLAAIVLMPLLTWLYLNQSIEIPANSLLLSLVQLVLIPLLFGLVVHHFWQKKVSAYQSFFSGFAMLAISFIVAIVIALNQSQLDQMVWTLVLAIILHNTIGLMSGYYLAKKLGYNSQVARTLAIEIGMQNSGLSVALAVKYFSAASALPGALFSIWHNLSGALWASYWHKKP